MDGSYVRSRSKRPRSYHDREPADSNGRHKRHISTNSRGDPPPPPLPKPPPGDISFRILCPEVKAGSVIGKGGSIIKALRQETGAKITISDTVPGCEDRVILISAPERDRDVIGDRERGRDRDGRDRDNSSRERDGSRQREFRERDEREREGREWPDVISPAQEALLRVHSRIVEGGTLLNGSVVEEEDPYRLITTRLLVPNNHVGCLLGRGGKIIEQMREETKAQIRVLPRDQLPLCTLPSDEIVQIVGELNVVKKALLIISTRLRENPPRDRAHNSAAHGPMHSPSRHILQPRDDFIPAGNSLVSRGNVNEDYQSAAPSFSQFGRDVGEKPGYVHGRYSSLPDSDQQPTGDEEQLVFRILCPNDKVGSIIGKGGSIIRSLRDEIGARIRVTEPVIGSDERIVFISAVEHPDDNISPAQEALLHIQNMIVDLGPDEDAVITTRLLVPSNQIGCLLGKGGSIIAEMRRTTQANIRILGREELPKCAPSTDELVQIVGDIRAARKALIQVTRILRDTLHRGKSISRSSERMMTSQGRPVSPGRHDHNSPSKLYNSFSGFSIPSSGRSSSSYPTLSPSPGHWAAQDIGTGRSPLDYDSPPLQLGSGLFSRSTGTLVTKTTVEVVIPEHALNSIIGKPGNDIAQIRQISGAKVNLLDGRPGASERIVEISGTPEQTHAAQSLLQAFILNGQASSLGFTG